MGSSAFIIFTELHNRAGAIKSGSVKRCARVTGSILLPIFVLEWVLFWLQDIKAMTGCAG